MIWFDILEHYGRKLHTLASPFIRNSINFPLPNVKSRVLFVKQKFRREPVNATQVFQNENSVVS